MGARFIPGVNTGAFSAHTPLRCKSLGAIFLRWLVLNAGTGKAYSFNDVIRMLNQKLESAIEPKYTENPIKNYVRHTLADTSKCRAILKFKAQFTLEEGISKLVDYY